MTIQLPEELGRSVRDEVRSGHFTSEVELVTEAVQEFLRRRGGPSSAPSAGEDASSPPSKPIWDVAAELRSSAPAEEWAKLPTDGAARHDRYLYGDSGDRR